MIIYKSGDIIKSPVVVMLGLFDGLHLGHKKLIDTARTEGKTRGLPTVLFTFSSNPKTDSRALITNERKIELCEDMGIDGIYFRDFTEDFKRMTPDGFIEYIKNTLNAAVVVAGFDYRFGFRHSGTVDMLQNHGFELFVVPEFKLMGGKVSSTAIRESIEAGNLSHANEMLGYVFSIDGVVADGRKVGRRLGFRTANLVPPKGIVLPKNGVYATKTVFDGETYLSVTNIGVKPTFNLKDTTIETHVLGFSGELYGKRIRIEFYKRLRGEIAFSSKEELSAQIENDVKATVDLLGGRQ